MNLIDNLKIFRRVAERHSFTEVALELGVKQSTVSKAVAALEADLGVQLFLRSTRGVTLTAEGEKLHNGGGSVLDQLETLLADVKSETLLLQGPLKITSSLGFTRLILIPLLDEFRRRHPLVTFDFHLGDGMSDLVTEGIDLAIRLGPLEDSALKAIPLGAWERAFFAAPSYLAHAGIPHTLGDLDQHQLIFYKGVKGRPGWTMRDEDGVKKDLFIKPYLQSNNGDFLREAVIKGLGIGLAPSWMMIEAEREGLVVRLLQQYTSDVYPITMLTAGSTLSAKQRAFTEYLRESFQKIPELNVAAKKF